MKTHYPPNEEMFYTAEITVARKEGPTRYCVFIPKRHHDADPVGTKKIAENIEKAMSTYGSILPLDAVTQLLWHNPQFIRKTD